MATWAIVIGINRYQHLKSLQYAKRDAALVRDFLVKDAKFDQVYYFSDDSPEVVLDGGATLSTRPTLSNLRHFLEVRFAKPSLKADDTLWFFFAGHGLQYGNGDYLMPSDSEPEAAETTALSIDHIADCLRRSGASNIVLALDACHTEEQKFGQGFGTDPQGVVTIFSSGFGEISHEIEGLQQSSFTFALLEALRDKNQTTTMEHLYRYLQDRVPKLNLRYDVPPQVPRISADPSVPLSAIPIPHPVSRYRKWLAPVFPRSEEPSEELDLDLTSVTPRRLSSKTFWAEFAGLVALAGVLGYMAYQTWDPQPVGSSLSKLKEAAVNNPTNSPSPQASSPLPGQRVTPSPSISNTAKPNSSIASPAPTASPGQSSSTITSTGDIYQRLPRTGTYYATSSLLNASRREIGSSNAHLCIKIVNGPPAASSGYEQITVSSLSVRKDGIYVDATYDKLTVDNTYTEFTDSKGTWQLLDRKVDLSGLMAECLAAKKSFTRQTKGALVQGNS